MRGWVGCRMLDAKGQNTVLDEKEEVRGFYMLRNFYWNSGGDQIHSSKTSLMPLAYFLFLRVSVPEFWMSGLVWSC